MAMRDVDMMVALARDGAPVGDDNPMVMTVPTNLLTGGAGTEHRIKVDNSEADFWAGRAFRANLEYVLATSASEFVVNFTSTVNFVMTMKRITLTQGAIRHKVYTGSTYTASGSDVTVTPRRRNLMTTVDQTYTSGVTITYGGTRTGGTEVSRELYRAASQNVAASNVVGAISERGYPPGSYMAVFSTLDGGLTPNDAAQFLFELEWLERPTSIYG